jgi:hypothetical protein
MARGWSTAAITTADAGLLAFLRPDFRALAHGLAAPNAWLARDGVDRILIALAGAALWVTAAWVALGLLATFAGRLPGAAGRLSTHAGQLLVPRVFHRVIAGSAGLGVLLAPVAAGAKTAPLRPAPSHITATRSAPAVPVHLQPLRSTAVRSVPGSGVRAPTWPVGPAAHPSSRPRSPGPVPAPTWPATRPAPSRQAPSRQAPSRQAPSRQAPSRQAPSGPAPSGPARPSGSAPGPHTPSRPSAPPHANPHSGRPGPAAAHVTVSPGDSLWLIAARRLDPDATPAQVAAAWPRWYAANRAVIGDDPALIRPGQVLAAPPPTPPPPPPPPPPRRPSHD